jgi:RnfABCDGE-type electron transport complex B subunit
MNVLTAVGFLGGLTLLLATLLVLANRRLAVAEDPRVGAVEEMLPHTNCGACGFPGCLAFAEALVEGRAQPAGCTVGDEAARRRIAGFLGVDVGRVEKRVARLACAGGANVARRHAHYHGLETCNAASQVAGGGKGCFWGCLGLGDCEVACDFDAIRMNEQGLPVVDEARCTACGDCVDACPKALFSLEAASHRLWVACRSLEAGDEMLEDCEVGCTACGRCAFDAPDLIEMKNNLPVVDYGRGPLSKDAIERCPTGAIVWLESDGRVIKGAAARKPIRRGPRPMAPT